MEKAFFAPVPVDRWSTDDQHRHDEQHDDAMQAKERPAGLAQFC